MRGRVVHDAVYSTAVDYDSDRRSDPERQRQRGGYVTADLSFKRSLENLQLTFEPRYTWRRYSDSTLGNGDDRGASLARSTGHWSAARLNASRPTWIRAPW